MNLYNCIFYRQSIRKFLMDEISAEDLEGLQEFMKSIEPLYANIPYTNKIINMTKENKSISGIASVKAPYYLAFYTEMSNEALINAGYILEQIVLYLTGKDIGSCYQGMVLEEKIFSDNGKNPVIVLAFGKSVQKLNTEKNINVKRLPLSQLAIYKTEENNDINQMLDAARRAPSALNGQPWRFIVYPDKIDVFKKKKGLLIRVSDELQYIDMGIMLSHISIAAEDIWIDIDIKKLEDVKEKLEKGSVYVTSILYKM